MQSVEDAGAECTLVEGSLSVVMCILSLTMWQNLVIRLILYYIIVLLIRYNVGRSGFGAQIDRYRHRRTSSKSLEVCHWAEKGQQ